METFGEQLEEVLERTGDADASASFRRIELVDHFGHGTGDWGHQVEIYAGEDCGVLRRGESTESFEHALANLKPVEKE